MSPVLVISCATLILALDGQGRAVSLRHRATGHEFLAARAAPAGLWQMGLMRPVAYSDPLPPLRTPAAAYQGHEWFANRDEYRADLEIDADAAPAPEMRTEGGNAELTWTLAVPGGNATLRLAIAGGEGRGLEFRARVALPGGWALKRLTYPRLRGFGDLSDPDADALLYPETWGVLRRNPLEDMTAYTGQHPSFSNWCQMTAWLHGRDGLYLGVLDPEAGHTGIDAQYVEGDRPAPMGADRRFLREDAPAPAPAPRVPLAQRLAAGAKPAMQLRCHHWPAMSAAWSSPYPVVLQGFAGDWQEAAAIHRAWATRQRWCRRGPLAERKDASPALAGIDLWFMKYGFPPGSMHPRPASEVVQSMTRLQDFFQMPFGLHWYHWHAFNWHRNFPGHAPPVQGFAEAVKDLQGRGIVVMPYCQGRLLYRDRAGFAEERTHACAGADGQPPMEMYTPRDDWPLALCPGDPWSRAQWLEAARLLWRDCGVDGIYFDQVAAMYPSLCYHAGHGHALGGGNQWSSGYDRALAAMEPLVREERRRFLASELMTDAYMDRVDLYLAFVPSLEDYVPLHPAIYGGYTTLMGRSTPYEVLADPQLFAMCQGEQLLFGGQLGWTGEEILAHPRAARYLRDLALLRAGLRDFLHLGTLERETAVRQEARLKVALPPSLTGKPHPVRLDRPAVRHTVWRAPDGALLVLLLNEALEPAAVDIRLPALAPSATWRLSRLGLAESGHVAPADGSVRLDLRGLEVAALVGRRP